MRPSGRANDQLREITIETNVTMHAKGSCIIKCGNTHVLCTASVEENVPRWMKGKGKGWVTAEYGMLPGSTSSRVNREASSGKQSGRTQEIQRLIGRSLRAVVDLKAIGERQIIVDCDVLQADGGTRTASITGAYVALHLAFDQLCREDKIAKIPFTHNMAAISCGIYKGEVVLDLDYAEDSNAHADSNFVMTEDGKIIEVQGTAEDKPFDEEQLVKMLQYAKKGICELIKIQNNALGIN